MLLLTGIGLPDMWKLPAVLPPFVEGTLGGAAITWTAQRKKVKTKDVKGIMTCRSVQAVVYATWSQVSRNSAFDRPRGARRSHTTCVQRRLPCSTVSPLCRSYPGTSLDLLCVFVGTQSVRYSSRSFVFVLAFVLLVLIL